MTITWLSCIYKETRDRYSGLVVQLLSALRAASGKEQLMSTLFHRLPVIDDAAVRYLLDEWCTHKDHNYVGLSAILMLFKMDPEKNAPCLDAILRFAIAEGLSFFFCFIVFCEKK